MYNLLSCSRRAIAQPRPHLTHLHRPSRHISLSSPHRIADEDSLQSSGTTTTPPSSTTDSPDSASNSSPPTPTTHSAPTNRPKHTFLTAHALFAKRPSRPFPPPFLSLPSHSFSDPLSTHNRATDKRHAAYQGVSVRGVTNGDDALLAESNMVAVADGVGAWAQKERGHASLWSRLMLHFWATETTRSIERGEETDGEKFKKLLQTAFEHTKDATQPPTEWFGTTTASGAFLVTSEETGKPVLHVAQLGDSAILVLRPGKGDEEALLYKTEEQWHWFDCPRQLGTNSPDTPEGNAVVDSVEVEEGDVVVGVSDGVSDNLWIHEVVANVCGSVRKYEKVLHGTDGEEQKAEAMRKVAVELMRAARVIAEDPFAESPFMERAVEEGLPTEGGKLDDISVVVGLCRRNPEG